VAAATPLAHCSSASGDASLHPGPVSRHCQSLLHPPPLLHYLDRVRTDEWCLVPVVAVLGYIHVIWRLGVWWASLGWAAACCCVLRSLNA